MFFFFGGVNQFVAEVTRNDGGAFQVSRRLDRWSDIMSGLNRGEAVQWLEQRRLLPKSCLRAGQMVQG